MNDQDKLNERVNARIAGLDYEAVPASAPKRFAHRIGDIIFGSECTLCAGLRGVAIGLVIALAIVFGTPIL